MSNRSFLLVFLSAVGFYLPGATKLTAGGNTSENAHGAVQCANLVYGNNKKSKCFSAEFLAAVGRDTNVVTQSSFSEVGLDSPKLFEHPFAIMTGEGSFSLTSTQRENMRSYLTGGGFIVASAGCSSQPWVKSFRQEITSVFPEIELKRIDMTHPIFHTVYDINELKCKRPKSTWLEGLEIDGKIVLIFSKDGLNDTSKAGKKCCCCGGNEIRNARQININLLVYTLTH